MGRGLDGFLLISVHWRCVVLRARGERSLLVSGGYGEGETPLPIPNRAVKPLSADGTWPARAWESRSPPVLTSPRLQLVQAWLFRACRSRIGAPARDRDDSEWISGAGRLNSTPSRPLAAFDRPSGRGPS